jgi:hypothetical protein
MCDSVSIRASEPSRCCDTAIARLRGFQNGQDGHGAAEELESAVRGGNVLGVAGARTEVVAHFVIAATEPRGRPGALEAAHRPVSAFQASMILFQSVVPVAAGAVAHFLTLCGRK